MIKHQHCGKTQHFFRIHAVTSYNNDTNLKNKDILKLLQWCNQTMEDTQFYLLMSLSGHKLKFIVYFNLNNSLRVTVSDQYAVVLQLLMSIDFNLALRFQICEHLYISPVTATCTFVLWRWKWRECKVRDAPFDIQGEVRKFFLKKIHPRSGKEKKKFTHEVGKKKKRKNSPSKWQKINTGDV